MTVRAVVSLLVAITGLGASVFTTAMRPVDAPAVRSPQASAAAAPAAPNDYRDPAAWLCRPGREDACAVDLTTTVVAADGSFTREPWRSSGDASVDCFYVYPTVSTDPTAHSDMTADEAERKVVRQQFARFASVCRPFAPLYRQVTLAGLRAVLQGEGAGSLREGLGYADVRDAFRSYLEHDNQGRGFVLVGHSQGAFILTELVRTEIDGKPLAKQLVSALLLGATVSVARGQDRGGDLTEVPLCREAAQTRCVLTYATFRSTLPPPANTLFGKVIGDGREAACTNPAALGGGSGELHAYLSTRGDTITAPRPPRPWVTPERPIDTPWVSVPGLLTARCATNEHATYLEVTVHGRPDDPRTDEITGDIVSNGQVAANWGLHLIDVELAIGNLIEIVRRQSAAYAGKR